MLYLIINRSLVSFWIDLKLANFHLVIISYRAFKTDALRLDAMFY